MKKTYCLYLLFFSLSSGIFFAAAEELTYSKTSDTEPWTAYIKELIIEALKAQNEDEVYTLVPSSAALVQKRALTMLKAGEKLDIFWTMTSEEREQGLFVLRFPLLRGLLGQRFLVVRKSDAENFLSVRTIAEAQQFLYGQGHDWPDADILESAGFRVQRVASYINLMKMVDQGRFDAFPLGMNEIWDEVAKRPELNVSVDTNIVFSYQAPVFIFLNQSDRELQQKITKGFEIIIENGTFETIFNKYYHEIISRGNLEERTIFKLQNHYMSTETQEAMKKYSSILIVK